MRTPTRAFRPKFSRGFALPDLIGSIALSGVLLAVIALSASSTRRLASLGTDLSSLRTIHGSTLSYAADFGDRMWQFSWRRGGIYWNPQDPAAAGLAPTSTDNLAALQQMTYLIRTLGNRTPAEIPNYGPVALWPYRIYGHLPLINYMGLPAPSRLFTSTADARWFWAGDPRGYDQGLYTPNLGTGIFGTRHPYGASFLVGTCFYDNAPIGSRMMPQTTGSHWIAPGLPDTFYGKLLTEVHHPSQKVFMQDTIARHAGPQPLYHMFPQARFPVLMCDGAAVVRPSSHANRGVNPNTPAAPADQIRYDPQAIDPPSPAPNTMVDHGPLWTRMGMHGRDFGGPEVFPAP
jgi:hypothetical protein